MTQEKLERPDNIEVRHQESGSGDVCRGILNSLPEWFGVTQANKEYAASADQYPTIVASADGKEVGLLVAIRRSEFAAEVHLMAVRPDYHRRGIGTLMLVRLEHSLKSEGIEFLQVKTLSGRSPDQAYAKTRAFYLTYGFRPLEELPNLWDAKNPALQMIKAVRPRPGPRDSEPTKP